MDFRSNRPIVVYLNQFSNTYAVISSGQPPGTPYLFLPDRISFLIRSYLFSVYIKKICYIFVNIVFVIKPLPVEVIGDNRCAQQPITPYLFLPDCISFLIRSYLFFSLYKKDMLY